MDKITIDLLTKKNLLAFSAGVDSTALFFLLLENNIEFDIAIVDYNQRAQSKDEVIYATQLAHKYGKKCFISEYKDDKFSEKSARDFRYSFFDEIILNEKYETLLTAHQLNDKLEWFLMQFTKGAGLSELLGMEKKTFNGKYFIIKPLLLYTKEQLQNYLDSNCIKYFIDHSNEDQKYKRNYFRHQFSQKLLDEFGEGISKSFEYMKNDLDTLLKDIKIDSYEQLNIYTYSGDMNIALRIVDKDLKKRGIIISKDTRDEIASKKELVISHKIAVAILEDKIYTSPYIDKSMTKDFKEKCRINKIPKLIRPYLSTVKSFSF